MDATVFDTIRQGDAARLELLLDGNPRLAAARTDDGATTVLWAVYTRHAELAPLLLRHREPDFYEACALGRLALVNAMLANDAGLARSFSADGFSALGLAVFFGHLDIARRLVEAGADVDAVSRNSLRVAPLHSAVASGNLELLNLLLTHGAKPDTPEFLEMTPLHSAAAHGNRAMVESLLKAGADRTRKTKDGQTVADLAHAHGHPEIAGLL